MEVSPCIYVIVRCCAMVRAGKHVGPAMTESFCRQHEPQTTRGSSQEVVVVVPLPIPFIMGTSNGNTTNGAAKWGEGLTQTDLMEKDTVLVLDDQDHIIGSASKKESHVFSPEQPRAILHRAFSVFLFDKSDGRLLLQQRASTKITFPNVCFVEHVVYPVTAACLTPLCGSTTAFTTTGMDQHLLLPPFAWNEAQ